MWAITGVCVCVYVWVIVGPSCSQLTHAGHSCSCVLVCHKVVATVTTLSYWSCWSSALSCTHFQNFTSQLCHAFRQLTCYWHSLCNPRPQKSHWFSSNGCLIDESWEKSVVDELFMVIGLQRWITFPWCIGNNRSVWQVQDGCQVAYSQSELPSSLTKQFERLTKGNSEWCLENHCFYGLARL